MEQSATEKELLIIYKKEFETTVLSPSSTITTTTTTTTTAATTTAASASATRNHQTTIKLNNADKAWQGFLKSTSKDLPMEIPTTTTVQSEIKRYRNLATKL
ncbi:unnamed protein product [Rotaria sordida]|uniref:Uncharacterized protein n=1 Tax=Rotaria sordida TaxID=392033 RepID=A0A815C1X7_9BILA|nr:unnamed protein product [Rotaria sordida]CAF1280976.1 unnamed protein product [Rotaria sordida]CAF1294887.1 unnamed protein product [Rotaria sordida]CAF3775925.1 unnamed protein product [Rotaria sordida]CAF3794917.1 unnamed protein product [Rotaria sordida]